MLFSLTFRMFLVILKENAVYIYSVVLLVRPPSGTTNLILVVNQLIVH